MSLSTECPIEGRVALAKRIGELEAEYEEHDHSAQPTAGFVEAEKKADERALLVQGYWNSAYKIWRDSEKSLLDWQGKNENLTVLAWAHMPEPPPGIDWGRP